MRNSKLECSRTEAESAHREGKAKRISATWVLNLAMLGVYAVLIASHQSGAHALRNATWLTAFSTLIVLGAGTVVWSFRRRLRRRHGLSGRASSAREAGRPDNLLSGSRSDKRLPSSQVTGKLTVRPRT
jgi:cytochrome bd-type quinol oxidase subunit 2